MTVWSPSSQAKVTLEYNYRHERMSGNNSSTSAIKIRLRVKESKPTQFLKRWLQMLKMTVWAPSSQAKVTLKYNCRHEGINSSTSAIKNKAKDKESIPIQFLISIIISLSFPESHHFTFPSFPLFPVFSLSLSLSLSLLFPLPLPLSFSLFNA